LRNGAQSSLLFSVTSELFLLPRGVVPFPPGFRGFRVGGFALSFVFTVLQIVSSFQNDSPCEGSFNLLALALDADERVIAAVFSGG